jgi:hypothetical protein
MMQGFVVTGVLPTNMEKGILAHGQGEETSPMRTGESTSVNYVDRSIPVFFYGKEHISSCQRLSTSG